MHRFPPFELPFRCVRDTLHRIEIVAHLEFEITYGKGAGVTMLINAYVTHCNPPPLEFPHELNNRRDRTDPELLSHLHDFVGFILARGQREMTQSLYHVMRHIERVQHQFSLEVGDEHLDAFGQWATDANAIVFLPDATVRDPWGEVLVDPQTGEPDENAEVPFPEDAWQRKQRTEEVLSDRGIAVYEGLPPVVSEVEVDLRSHDEVAARSAALFVVALRAESLATQNEIPVSELMERIPFAFTGLTDQEKQFIDADSPEQQQIIDGAWRYESLFLLQWALGLVEELPYPSGICDVSMIARIMLDQNMEELVANAALRPTRDILDALDLHFRLHWALRNAQSNSGEPPADIEPGVVVERHTALNWLVRFENADWDDVTTPT